MSVKVTKKQRKNAKTYDRIVSEMAEKQKDKKLSKEAKTLLDKLIPEPVPYDPKIDEDAIERLVTSRISLLLNKPFFGNLATRLILRNADEWCPTAATDGRYFYYNSRFIMRLRPKEVDFLVGHEVLHVVYDHIGRRGDRNPKLWNIANDYLVNFDLKQDNVGELITTVEILYDSKYDGWASEEVYDELLEKAKKQQQQQQGQQQQGDGQGQGQGGGQGQPGQSGGGQSNNQPTDEEIQDALGDLLDKVLDEHIKDTDEGDDGSGSGKDGEEGKGTNGPVPMTDAERRALKDEVREAVLQAAEQAGAGNVPSNVKRMIKDLTEPKIDWRELIAQQIESIIKADFSWQKPSRRSAHFDAIMPGQVPGQMIDVCVAIDTSGSISTEMLKEFLSEVQGIMDQFEDYNLHVWCFDTTIHNPQKFSHDTSDQISEYEAAGFGGTDFEVNWTWMKEEDVEPKKFIVFTDGYPYGSWGDPDYCETVWIINGNKNDEPPFGIWAYYDEQ
jgi:predicted metal-dependent peptidase